MESTPLVNLGLVDYFKNGKDKYNVEILIYRCSSHRFQFVANIVQEGHPPSSKVIHFDVVLSIVVQDKRDEFVPGFTVDIEFWLGHLKSTFKFNRFTHEHARTLQNALMDFTRTHV